MALEFSPLYWIYHDGWNYKQTKTLLDTDDQGNIIRIDKSKTFYQMGHCHLFLMDINPESKGEGGQAYWGEQKYEFHLEDEWGPNSKDPSQAQSIKLIGKPIWYFYIEEYWRRFYIQPWETNDQTFRNGIHDGKVGIKYDASKPQHTLGPFREGGEFYFFDTVVNRTMPIEYWKSDLRQTRDYYIKQQREGEETSGKGTWSFPIDEQFFKWVEDTHYEPEAIGMYNARTHRIQQLHHNNYDYTYDWQGMNAKRIKTDKYIQYPCDWGEWAGRNDKIVDSYEKVSVDEYGTIVVDDTVDWEGHPKFNYYSSENPYHQYRFGERAWTGWYEYGEIVRCVNGKWYKREWRPYGYEMLNFDTSIQPCWTTSKRRNFPNPPPWLCDPNDDHKDDSNSNYNGEWESAEAERISRLHWEYFLYFDRVRHYNQDGSAMQRWENTNVWDEETGWYEMREVEEWEDRIERYKEENGIEDESNSQPSHLTLEEENECFALYVEELGMGFFEKWMDRIDQATGKVQIANGGYEWDFGVNSEQTYLTFSDFRKVWRELTSDEMEKWNFYGDMPRRNSTPIPDTLHSAFYPRSKPLSTSTQQSNSLSESESELDESQNFPTASPYDPFRQGEADPIGEWKKYFTRRETFTIPNGTTAQGDGNVTSWKGTPYKPLPHPREQSYSAEDGARRQYPDDWFVSPIIEYQRVVQLDWERLPQHQGEEGYIEEHWNERGSAGNWGDGFDVTISIPFRKNEQIQSPFSDDNRQVQPIGKYCHNVVSEESKLRHHVEKMDSIAQLRKYDFPGYVDFTLAFRKKYPLYTEDFDDPDATTAKLAATRKTDPTIPEGFETWGDARNAFWGTYEFPMKNQPITRRSDENQYASNGVWRAKTTHLLVQDDKLDDDKNPKTVQWNNPYPSKTDGQWMEQCLGAIVKAKVKLVLEDALGHRSEAWCDAYAMKPEETIQGKDHDAKK